MSAEETQEESRLKKRRPRERIDPGSPLVGKSLEAIGMNDVGEILVIEYANTTRGGSSTRVPLTALLPADAPVGQYGGVASSGKFVVVTRDINLVGDKETHLIFLGRTVADVIQELGVIPT